MNVQYSHNRSTFIDICKHLKVVSPFFLPPLEGRVDIEKYANKLFTNAEREEAYYSGELTGLIAYYYTEGKKEAFISNVSVLPDFKNRGIASSLLSKVKLFLHDKGVCKISMEVANNKPIIDFYRKNGFDLDKEIDDTKFMMVSYLNDQIPLVSILCLVYNHKNFIRECLDGFVMQQTNFTIEILIHDDASTDGSAKIIREYEEKYPMLFKPIYQTINQYSKGVPVSSTYQYPRCSGKYIAVCEGDDCWIDPFKLQKQVDILENNEQYSMCHTSFRYYYKKQNKFLDSKDIVINQEIIHRGLLLEDLLDQYRIQTVTVLFRSNVLEDILNSDEFLYKSGYFLMGDIQLWIGLFKSGRLYFLPEITSVYRKAVNSSTTQKDKKKYFRFSLSSAELRKYLSEKNLFSKAYKQKVERRYNQALMQYYVFDPSFIPIFPLNKKYISISQYVFIYCLKMYSIYRFYLCIFITLRSWGGVLLRFISKNY